MKKPAPLPVALTGKAFSVAQAQRNGVSAGRLRRADLQAPFRGVRTPIRPEMDFTARCRAYAALQMDSTVFSHITAGRLWGMPLPYRLLDDDLHVLGVGATYSPRMGQIVGHKSNRPMSFAMLDGLPVSPPIETWLQLSSMLRLDELIAAGDRLIGAPDPLTSIDEILASVTGWTGQRGVRSAREAVAELRPWSRSPKETYTRLALLRSSMPEPELNAVIVLPNGFRLEGDLVYRQWKVLLEYEGDHHRTDDRQWAKDLRRYNQLSQAGWIALRISRHMPPAEVVALASRALHAHGWIGVA